MRTVANSAQATWDKFRKERDFHRMHHQRVIQEKNKLVDDIRRLRTHMRSYEPAIEEVTLATNTLSHAIYSIYSMTSNLHRLLAVVVPGFVSFILAAAYLSLIHFSYTA